MHFTCTVRVHFMKTLLIFFFIIFALILIWHFLTKKYLNPYKLYVIFGPKGIGKSTLLQKLANHYQKLHYNVYCNIGDCTAPGVIQIPIEELPRLSRAGHLIYHYKDFSLAHEIEKEYKEHPYIVDGKPFEFPPFVKLHSVIFHDEINLMYDNRSFKEFSKETQRYFRLQRHYKHIYIGLSQTFDCDKKIRDLADYIVLLRKSFRVWIHSEAWYKVPRILRATEENSRETSAACDDFKPMGLFYDWFSSPFCCWLPKWVKKHDSFK